jgi:hypothetical protein
MGSSFGAGSREIVQVNLVTSPDVGGPFQISLTDQLVTRCVSDAFANELPVSYVSGTVTVNSINPNPTLVITQSGTNVVLSWPLWAADFTLQTSEGTNGARAVGRTRAAHCRRTVQPFLCLCRLPMSRSSSDCTIPNRDGRPPRAWAQETCHAVRNRRQPLRVAGCQRHHSRQPVSRSGASRFVGVSSRATG